MSTPEYDRQTEEKDIHWFLDTVIVRDIQQVIDAGSGYLAFALVAQAIEMLGALLDEKEIHDHGGGLPEKRFAKAMDDLFAPINKDYGRYNKGDSDYYLYKYLRCGMAHVLRPQTRIVFTGRTDADKLKLKHLTEVTLEGYAEPQLLLVIENFHDDLKEAVRRAEVILKKTNHPKLRHGYITISRFKHTFETAAPLNVQVAAGQSFAVTSPSLSGGPVYDFTITGLAPGAR